MREEASEPHGLERTLRHSLPRDKVVTLSGKGRSGVPDLPFKVLAIDGRSVARSAMIAAMLFI